MGHVFRKAVLAANRTYVTKNGTRLHATPARLQSWVDTFKKIRAKKILVPCSWGHNSQAEPVAEDEQDSNEYWKSVMRAGTLDDLEYNDKEGMLYATGTIPTGEVSEDGNIYCWTRLPDGREIRTGVNEVSIAVSRWRDGDGQEWADAPIHLGLVILPVGHDHGGFMPHTPTAELSITPAESEVLYFALSMADTASKPPAKLSHKRNGDFEGHVYRATGGEGELKGFRGVTAMGKGLYVADSAKHAKAYGSDVKKAHVKLRMMGGSTPEYRAIEKEAKNHEEIADKVLKAGYHGVVFPHPFGAVIHHPEKAKAVHDAFHRQEFALGTSDPVKPKPLSPQKATPSQAASPKAATASASQPSPGGGMGKAGWLPLFQQPQNKTAAPQAPINEPALAKPRAPAQQPMPVAPPPPKPDFHGLTDWNKVEEHNQKYGMPGGMAHTLGQVAPGLPRHLQGVPTAASPATTMTPPAPQAKTAAGEGGAAGTSAGGSGGQPASAAPPSPAGHGRQATQPAGWPTATPAPATQTPGTASLTGAAGHQPAAGPAPAPSPPSPAAPTPTPVASPAGGGTSQHATHLKNIRQSLNTTSRAQVKKAVQAAQQAGVPPRAIKKAIQKHYARGLPANATSKQRRQAIKRARFIHNYATAAQAAKPVKPGKPPKPGKVQSAFGGVHLHKDLADIDQKFDTAEQAHKAQGQYEQEASHRAKSVADGYVKKLMGAHAARTKQHQFVWNLVHWIASKIPFAGPLRAALRRLHGKHAALMGQDHAAQIKAAKQEMSRVNVQSRMMESKHKAHAIAMRKERIQKRNEKRAEHREGREWERGMGLLSTLQDFTQWAHFSTTVKLEDGKTAKLPDDHIPAMEVPKSGSCCASCEYYDGKGNCRNKYFAKWNGSHKIPGDPEAYCSDWYEPAKKSLLVSQEKS